MKSTSVNSRRLVESGILIGLGTILSLIKVFELPYGGSITLCSMLPIVILGYKYGTKWGMFSGLVYGILQMMLGGSGFKGLSIGAVFGSAAFDYLVAFSMLGIAGVMRGKVKNISLALSAGVVVGGFGRLVSHIISGYIFFGDYAEWFFSQDGFAMGETMLNTYSGQALAFVYSVVYNISYMIPEIIISVIVAFILSRFLGEKHLVN